MVQEMSAPAIHGKSAKAPHETASHDPASHDPASREPASRDLTTDGPASHEPASHDLATDGPASHEPASHETAAKDASPHELATDGAGIASSQPPWHAREPEHHTDLTVVWVVGFVVLAALVSMWFARGRDRRDDRYELPPRPRRRGSKPSSHEAPAALHGSGTSSLASERGRSTSNQPEADRSPAPRQLVSPGPDERAGAERPGHGARSTVAAAAYVPAAELDEIRRQLGDLKYAHETDARQILERLDDLQRLVAMVRWQATERAPSGDREAPPHPARDSVPTAGLDSLEGRLLQVWNDVDWEHGAPSLSQIQRLLRDESYDLVEGIVGTYALAVPQRSGDDARSPVYILPFLGIANKHYDGSLFDRPQHGDSARLSAAAKVQFVERAETRWASLERLKAGAEKLSQVFTVVEPGRIE
jgi:hypothetical protein